MKSDNCLKQNYIINLDFEIFVSDDNNITDKIINTANPDGVDLILEIGKQLQSFEADGEFTGVAKFSKKDCQAMKTKLSKIVKNAGSCNYFEYAVDSMLEKHDIYAVDVSNFPVIEVDTKEDLEQARNLFNI